jgi:hypothetical protein
MSVSAASVSAAVSWSDPLQSLQSRVRPLRHAKRQRRALGADSRGRARQRRTTPSSLSTNPSAPAAAHPSGRQHSTARLESPEHAVKQAILVVARARPRNSVRAYRRVAERVRESRVHLRPAQQPSVCGGLRLLGPPTRLCSGVLGYYEALGRYSWVVSGDGTKAEGRGVTRSGRTWPWRGRRG